MAQGDLSQKNNKIETEPIKPLMPEKSLTPEKGLETVSDSKRFEQGRESQEHESRIETPVKPEGKTDSEINHGIVAATNATQRQKEREKQIEQVLESGLDDFYLALPPVKQEEFKKAGEETSKKIGELMDQVKVKTKKIVELIKKWLSLLPGVNKFFLEQEAKLKTDKILKLKEK